jgi:alkylation response protein AidB-like acyl-CoA dehydrogenase
MHNLELDDEQVLIQETVRKLVQDSVAPAVLDLDEHRTFDQKGLTAMAELGLLGLPVAETRGGAGMGMLAYAVAVEELARSSGSLARLLVVHAGQCGKALESLDSAEEQRTAIAAGERMAAFVGPEHRLAAAGGKLTGKAELVTGGGTADVLIVVAHDAGKLQLFAVEAAACKRSELLSLGFASAAPARVEFAGVAGVLLAEGDAATAAVRAAQAASWLGNAALAVGLGTASVQAAHAHAGQRIAFGKPLLQQQAVARKLVEGRRHCDTARHLTWHTARLWDGGSDPREAAINARLFAVPAAVAAADEAIQILGGYGYVVEYHVERHYRDAQTLEVLDGAPEELREELARTQFASA